MSREPPADPAAAPLAGLVRPRPFVPCLVVLTHLAFLVLVFLLQPHDRLGEVSSFPAALSGEQDLAAMALRGLNATQGRSAGRLDVPDGVDDDTYSRSLKEETRLQPRYYLEYPHGNFVLFCLPWWLFGPIEAPPPALLDGSLANLVDHQPRDEQERAVWRQFRRATVVYRVVLLFFLAGLVLVLWRGYRSEGALSSSCWPLLLPCAFYYTVNRFDIVPVFFTALALALLGRRRPLLSGICLAAGAMSKVFPGLLLPLVLRYLLGQPGGRRAAAIWLIGFTLTILACVTPPLIREGFESVWSPYQWQMNRSAFLWTAYGYILPPFLAGATLPARLFRTSALLLTLAALSWWRIPDLTALVRRGGVLVVVFVLLQNVFSPQWIIWFWPFLLPLLGRHPRLAPLLVVLDLATIALWPHTPPWTFVADCVQATRMTAMLGIVTVLLLGPVDRERPPTPDKPVCDRT